MAQETITPEARRPTRIELIIELLEEALKTYARNVVPSRQQRLIDEAYTHALEFKNEVAYYTEPVGSPWEKAQAARDGQD